MPSASRPATATSRKPIARPAPRRALPRLRAEDAFERLPNAVMVCDRRGRVVAANARLRADLRAADAPGATCCTLLGCGRAGSELEGGCITAAALERGDALEEICVDSIAGRMRASAAPLYGDSSHVVVELRPERRAAGREQALRIFTLGPLRVASPDGLIGGGWIDQRAGQLLRYLVCERRRIAPADAVAEAIWPQAGPAAANSVRHFVHVLREQLEPQRGRGVGSSYVVCTRGGYALASGRVWIDADEFELEASRGMTALAAGDTALPRRLPRRRAVRRVGPRRTRAATGNGGGRPEHAGGHPRRGTGRGGLSGAPRRHGAIRHGRPAPAARGVDASGPP
jgi:hypothetical protein